MARRLLALFAKAPIPGQVKTRLCPPLSPAQAAELYQAMLLDVMDQLPESAPDLALWFSPPEQRDWFARYAPPGFRLLPQRGEELGSRMAEVFRFHSREGYDRIVLRGTDSPTLPAQRIEQAFAALEKCDVVICPDLDGGYNLIGLTEPHDELFAIEMSTSNVMQSTNARALESGLRVESLAAHHDVDTIADLSRLARDTGHERAPRTYRWLAAGTANGSVEVPN